DWYVRPITDFIDGDSASPLSRYNTLRSWFDVFEKYSQGVSTLDSTIDTSFVPPIFRSQFDFYDDAALDTALVDSGFPSWLAFYLDTYDWYKANFEELATI